MNSKLWNGPKRAWVYVAITFIITYVYEISVIVPMALNNPGDLGTQTLLTALIASVMFIPTIGMILTRLLTGEGFRDAWISLKLFPKKWKWYLLGAYGPALLILIGTAIFFLVFPGQFDPSMSALKTVLSQSGVGENMALVVVLSQFGLGLFLSPFINLIPAFGEEWGWRGYLFPKLSERFSPAVTCLMTGVIWGVWHAPITYVGHNYGMGYWGYPVTGILAMSIFCICVGTFLSWVTMHAKSCLPAALGHAGLNGFASVGMLLIRDASKVNPFVGPAAVGVVGGIGFIVTAALLLTFPKAWPPVTAPAPSTEQSNDDVSPMQDAPQNQTEE